MSNPFERAALQIAEEEKLAKEKISFQPPTNDKVSFQSSMKERANAAAAASSSHGCPIPNPPVSSLTLSESDIKNKVAGLDKLVKDLKGFEDGEDIEKKMQLLYLHSTDGEKKTWKEFNLLKEIEDALIDLRYDYPSKIQAMTLPDLLAGSNMIAQSQSGTGKTAAFSIAILSKVDLNCMQPQCIVLEPTFELAKQTALRIEQLACNMKKLKIVSAVKGVDALGDPSLAKGQVVVATPGKLKDWLYKQPPVIRGEKIKMFILDEADVMLDIQGLGDQTKRIKNRLPAECQKIFFSATFDEKIRDFAQTVVGPNSKFFYLEREKLSLDNIKQFYVKVGSLEDKYFALHQIYSALVISQSMIFCATKDTASWLSKRLIDEGQQVGLLTGDMDASDRSQQIERFRTGLERVLITTNVSARGLDIAAVNFVVNFDPPVDVRTRAADYETYLHRIGRSGRFGRDGMAVNFICNEQELNVMKQLSDYFGREIVELRVDDVSLVEECVDKYDKLAEDQKNKN